MNAIDTLIDGLGLAVVNGYADAAYVIGRMLAREAIRVRPADDDPVVTVGDWRPVQGRFNVVPAVRRHVANGVWTDIR